MIEINLLPGAQKKSRKGGRRAAAGPSALSRIKLPEGGDRITMFTIASTVVAVLLVGFLSLGLRTGTVVALTIPLVLAATFVLMRWFGIELHRVSTGALVIALVHNGLMVMLLALGTGARNTFMVAALWLGSALYTAVVGTIVSLFTSR